jgi:hypothetical protein
MLAPPSLQLELLPARKGSALPPKQSEHDAQVEVAKKLRQILLPDVCWSSVDHAHSLDRRPSKYGVPIGMLEAKKRKARGIRAGLPDFMFWHRAKPFAIEFKIAGGELTDEERKFLREMIRAGVEVKVCWGERQVVATVTAWGLTRVAA